MIDMRSIAGKLQVYIKINKRVKLWVSIENWYKQKFYTIEYYFCYPDRYHRSPYQRENIVAIGFK